MTTQTIQKSGAVAGMLASVHGIRTSRAGPAFQAQA